MTCPMFNNVACFGPEDSVRAASSTSIAIVDMGSNSVAADEAKAGVTGVCNVGLVVGCLGMGVLVCARLVEARVGR